jgi:hypothetical protein
VHDLPFQSQAARSSPARGKRSHLRSIVKQPLQGLPVLSAQRGASGGIVTF